MRIKYVTYFVRLKICATPNEKDLLDIFDKIGNIYYAMEYRNQPIYNREAPGGIISAAVASILQLSIRSADHFKISGVSENSNEPTSLGFN